MRLKPDLPISNPIIISATTTGRKFSLKRCINSGVKNATITTISKDVTEA